MLNLTTHCLRCKKNDNELNITTVQLICKNHLCWCCLRELRRNSSRYACPYCNRSHNIGKYVETDTSAIVETLPFCFDDPIFIYHHASDEITFNLDKSQLLDNCNTWIQELSNVAMNDSNKDRLAIIYLNVNSVREKMCNIYRILTLEMYDIVLLNETKLDDTVPLCFYQNHQYKMFRRDRGRAGGGLLVFVRKTLCVTFMFSSLEHEFMYFELTTLKNKLALICAYKSPSVADCSFLDALQDYMFTRNLELPLFVIGDLNMDLLSTQKCSKLLEFMQFLNLKNYVDVPTRIASRNMKASGLISHSETLIDVVLHNKDNIAQTNVVDHPISDHRIVIAFLNVPMPTKALSPAGKSIIKCNTNIETLDKINSSLALTVDETTKSIACMSDVNDKWLIFKKWIQSAMSEHSKKTRLKAIKKKDMFPWFDKELLKLRHQKEQLHCLVIKDKKNEILATKFKQLKCTYNKLLRAKQIAFFENKKCSDFKNSKKFYEFYKSYVKLKSDSDGAVDKSLKSENEIITAPVVVASKFNEHFSSLHSNSTVLQSE